MSVLQQAPSHPGKSQPTRPERGLLAYLLLPRPGDTSKWVIIPAGFVLGMLAAGSTSRASLGQAVLVWFVIEYLVYQARYQWNDIRGFAADQRHPDRQSRGRLPGPSSYATRNIALSTVVAIARLGLASVLLLLLPGRLIPVAYTASVAVLIVAVGYEALRSLATGPASMNRSRPVARTRLPVLLLWLVSGLGYLVRGLTGLALAVDLQRHWPLALIAGFALWAGGVGFVTARWAVESLAFGRLVGGRVSWAATPGQAREHQLALTRWLPNQPPDGDLPRWRPLRHGSAPTAPWNSAMLSALPAAAASGALLGGSDSAAAVVMTATIGLLTAGGLVLRPSVWWIAAGLTVLLIAEFLIGVPRCWLAVLPPLLAAAVYLCSMRQCLAEIGKLCRPRRRGEHR